MLSAAKHLISLYSARGGTRCFAAAQHDTHPLPAEVAPPPGWHQMLRCAQHDTGGDDSHSMTCLRLFSIASRQMIPASHLQRFDAAIRIEKLHAILRFCDGTDGGDGRAGRGLYGLRDCLDMVGGGGEEQFVVFAAVQRPWQGIA